MPTRSPIDRLRKLCLALPDATEKLSHGEPTFFAAGRVFAMFANNHHHDGRIAVWCKAPFGFQEILVGSKPDRFFVPPYVGVKGWVGVRVDGNPDWDEVASVVTESYKMTVAERSRPRARARSKPATPKSAVWREARGRK